MPDSDRKNVDRSLSMSTPVTRAKIENTMRRAASEQARGEAAGDEEHLQRAAFEEAEQPLRRLEEVDRVARRRRVEHDHVEVVFLAQLVQLRHRAQLLRARDGGRQLAVDRIRQDLIALALVGGEPRDYLVEGALAVEHHRPQLAVERDALLGEQGGLDPPRLARQLARVPVPRPAAWRDRS